MPIVYFEHRNDKRDEHEDGGHKNGRFSLNGPEDALPGSVGEPDN